MIIDILKEIRSHRSFSDKKISMDELRKMVESTRYAASARNAQKIRYVLINNEEICKNIFSLVKFAGAIPWNPTIEESPTAYILMCSEYPLNNFSENNLYFDMGTASHNIFLTAYELGYSGCIIGAYNKLEVEKLIELPEKYKSYILLALGEPKDKVTIVDAINQEITYSRDGSNNHFVPKLTLEDISLLEK